MVCSLEESLPQGTILHDLIFSMCVRVLPYFPLSIKIQVISLNLECIKLIAEEYRYCYDIISLSLSIMIMIWYYYWYRYSSVINLMIQKSSQLFEFWQQVVSTTVHVHERVVQYQFNSLQFINTWKFIFKYIKTKYWEYTLKPKISMEFIRLIFKFIKVYQSLIFNSSWIIDL